MYDMNPQLADQDCFYHFRYPGKMHTPHLGPTAESGLDHETEDLVALPDQHRVRFWLLENIKIFKLFPQVLFQVSTLVEPQGIM